MAHQVDRARVRAARLEGAARRITDQLRRAEGEQTDAAARWRHDLPELAAAVDSLAAIVEDARPTFD